MADPAETVTPTFTVDDPHWGRLTIDLDALIEKLGAATTAVYDAGQAAMYHTDKGFPIHSPWAMLLGGLTQAVDAVVEQVQAHIEAAGGSNGTS